MTIYETWEEFPSCRLDHITVTDAPANIVIVPLVEYGRLREALDSIVYYGRSTDSPDARTMIKIAEAALQEVGDE